MSTMLTRLIRVPRYVLLGPPKSKRKRETNGTNRPDGYIETDKHIATIGKYFNDDGEVAACLHQPIIR